MASFRKHNNGWEYRVRFKDPITQKYKETSRRGYSTKKEAQLAAAKVEQEIQNKIHPNTANYTYREVYNEWWAVHSKTIKNSSKYNNKSKHKRPLSFFGKMKIKEITREHCQKFIDTTAKEIKSVNDNKIQSNLVFKYAMKEGYIHKNPMENVVIPKRSEEILASEEKRNYWTKKEIKEFLEISKKRMEHMDYVMFYLLLFTGLRKGELLALLWEDFNNDDNSIRVNKTLYFEKGKEVVQKTKNYANRTIFLDNQAANLLKRWQVKQREELLADGIAIAPKTILARSDLRPLRLAYPNDTIASFIKSNNLHKITVHGFRHSHASILFEAGATIKEVQERLGHKDIKTTMNVYTHVTDTVKERTTSLLSAYMND